MPSAPAVCNGVPMSDSVPTFTVTRLALHGVAELVLAGPQYRRTGELALRVTPGGFATTVGPTVRVDGNALVADERRVPLVGSYRDVAAAAGVEPSAMTDVYSGGLTIAMDEPLEVDPAAARLIADALAVGDTALRAFDPDQIPILWPEHFDVAITAEGVNYGVSPGDDTLAAPYAYIGPHEPRRGEFWNQPFGSAVPLADLGEASLVAAYFRTGRDHARSDPPA